MPDQAAVLREMARGKNTKSKKMRVISVTSGKGGVGKTNFTVNLAIALADFGYRVVIMDGDLGLANVDVTCGITAQYTMEHLISGEKTLEEILIRGPKGIGILPGGSGVLELANLEREKLMNVLSNLGRLEKLTDILIIDTGAGLSETVMGFLRASDDIILVTTPEPTALTDAYGILKTLYADADQTRVNVVVNRVYSEEEAMATYERLDIAVRKFLNGPLNLMGWVYEDPLVGQAVMKQEPFGLVYPESSAYKCILWLAGTVSGLYLQPPRQAAGIKGFLSALLRASVR